MDDECLIEACKWIPLVRSVVISHNEFTATGARAMAKIMKKQQERNVARLGYFWSFFLVTLLINP